jgi:hypothetical protein
VTTQPTDTDPAPQPAAVQDSNARQALRALELLALEHAAAKVITTLLRPRLVAVQRSATRAWIGAFGSLDNPGDPIRTAAIAAQIRGELSQINVSASAQLADYAQRALTLGVRQAVNEVDTPRAAGALQKSGGALPVHTSTMTADSIGATVDVPTARIVAGLNQGIAAAVGDAETAVGKISGDSFAELDAALGKAHRAIPKAASAVVTAINGAANAGKRAVAEVLGVELLWLAEPDACVSCQGFAGHTTPAAQPFDTKLASTFTDKPSIWPPGPVEQPPLHPNCLPGDALVLPAGRVTGATARIYDGELVEIRTLNHKVFTATPNHPVLTDRGWIPVGLVDQGSYVVGTMGGKGVLLGDKHNQNMPSRIQDVAEAFLGAREVSARKMPVTAEDFHGDGLGSEVAVVGTYRNLGGRLDASLRQERREVLLQGADVRRGPLVLLSPSQQGPGAYGATSDGGVSRFGQPAPFLGAGLSHSQIHAGTSVASFDASFAEDSTYGPAADAVGFGDRLLAHSGLVQLDQVIEVRRYPFIGHVYNLETTEGWYIGNGIVSHNCRCELVPWLGTQPGVSSPSLPEALQREARRAILKGWSLPSESGAERIRAARKVLARNPAAPASVKAYARRAVNAGHFPTRDVPHYTPPVRKTTKTKH